MMSRTSLLSVFICLIPGFAAQAQTEAVTGLCPAFPDQGFVQLAGPPIDPQDALDMPWLEFSDEAEDIVMGPWPNGQTMDLLGGDDQLWMAPAVDTVTMGLGSDTLTLCAMRGLTASIDMGGLFASDPADADTVIIAAPVFRDTPRGFHSEIQIFGLQLPLDKVIVEVPQGWEGGTPVPGQGVAMQIGDVLIKLQVNLDQPFDPANMELFEMRAEGADTETTSDASTAPVTPPMDTPEPDAPQPSAPMQDTANLTRGGVFCQATAYDGGFSDTYGQPLCSKVGQTGCQPADPGAVVRFVLGAETGQSRAFGYEVWFGNGHSCALNGSLSSDGAGTWAYVDDTCMLRLDLDDQGAALVSIGVTPCQTSCGARATLWGVRSLWSDSPVSRPDPTLAQRLEEVCVPGAVLENLAEDIEGKVDLTAPTLVLGPDAFTLPPDVAMPLRAQRILNTLGYRVAVIDGIFGPRSRAALAAFLADQSAPGDGALTDAALQQLDRAMASRAVPPRPSDPEDMLRGIHADPSGAGIFGFTQRADWFTADTLDLIAWAEPRYSRRFRVDGFDFNPVMPSNEWSVEGLEIKVQSPPHDGLAVVAVRFASFGQLMNLTYHMQLEQSIWRIHDIATDQGSLRATLSNVE
jgi:peptidoglycan hydrolase-like protein with peptidoglycan-binding domain